MEIEKHQLTQILTHDFQDPVLQTMPVDESEWMDKRFLR